MLRATGRSSRTFDRRPLGRRASSFSSMRTRGVGGKRSRNYPSGRETLSGHAECPPYKEYKIGLLQKSPAAEDLSYQRFAGALRMCRARRFLIQSEQCGARCKVRSIPNMDPAKRATPMRTPIMLSLLNRSRACHLASSTKIDSPPAEDAKAC